MALKVYEKIVRRFLSIFYPAAVYQRYILELEMEREHFFASFRVLKEQGYLKIAGVPRSGMQKADSEKEDLKKDSSEKEESELNRKNQENPAFIAMLDTLKKGSVLPVSGFVIKEGETSPPKRYSSGSMILAMENAGQLIEDEELRAQIKGSGIGTSATRAEILKKLVNIQYLALNGKTQIITPTLLGELIFDVLEAMGVTLDQATAEAIYVAVSTDTGCFRYSNTTAKTLRVAAACLAAGAETYPINQEMFEKRRFARLRIDAYITEHVVFYAEGRLAIAAIPLEVEKNCGVTEDDMESVSTFARNIEGVCLAVTMRTLPDGQTKLSVRSAPGYDAAALCALFGGGGHKAAAGATLPMAQDEAKLAVENAFRQLGYL